MKPSLPVSSRQRNFPTPARPLWADRRPMKQQVGAGIWQRMSDYNRNREQSRRTVFGGAGKG